MSRELFYFVVVEGSEPFAFWGSTIFADPELSIGSLQHELTRKYSSSSLNCIGATFLKVSSVHVYSLSVLTSL